jgi:diadenosine tetraphosphatase ApaH/serine/threonine PP2A family protein phosphatase
MRVVVLSDIHANLAALEAVLVATTPRDALWVLGDTVGYGPDPDAVVARLALEKAVAVRGNHDAAVVGALETGSFNDDARDALAWTMRTIGPATRSWLDDLPERREVDLFTLVHGSPRDPLWEYLVSVPAARLSLQACDTRHCLVGHTHLPLVFRADDGRVEVISPSEGSRLHLDERRCIVNPGSVGQPRDGDPRACALTIDTDAGELTWLRVDYAVERTQALMRRAGLPARLVRRLELGL